MKNMQIYLAGAMSGLSFEEQVGWRRDIKNYIYNFVDHMFHPNVSLKVFNPCDYYNFEEKMHKTEREPFEFDLYNLKRSDLVIANLNKQDSIGTCMELAVAKDRRIPIVGLYEKSEELHPWISECCIRICNSMDELRDYVCEYYIV